MEDFRSKANSGEKGLQGIYTLNLETCYLLPGDIIIKKVLGQGGNEERKEGGMNIKR